MFPSTSVEKGELKKFNDALTLCIQMGFSIAEFR